MRPRRTSQGFTIVELLVVLVVLGILAAMAISALQNALDKSKQRATMADMRTVSKAVEIYAIDHGLVPVATGTIADLATLLDPANSTVVPTRDGWGRDFTYHSSGGMDYTIASFGKDGIDGADLSLEKRFDVDLDIVLANGVFVGSPE